MDNMYRVRNITYKRNAHCFCPLGKDWGTYEIEAKMAVNKEIPDYMEIDDYIMKNIDGKAMIIEEAGYTIKHFLETLLPSADIEIVITVKDAVHSYVRVEI